MKGATVSVNRRDYRWPAEPLVVICCDGSEPAYMDLALGAGFMPSLARIIAGGEYRLAMSAMPSFTNPNNLSIATGGPPALHGISGNTLIDPATGRETMMNDPKWLRAPTIFAAFQKAGASVAVVTAKDKLRALLGHGLAFDGTAICISAEKADLATVAQNGISDVCAWLGRPVPPVYSAALSEFVFAAGVKLLSERRPHLMYLSTTDYIQHKYAPGSDEANAFYGMMDRYLGELDAEGAALVIVADHGMKDKHLADGTPDVIYLQDAIDAAFGADAATVILPITDPYVVHHGALGSFATVYAGHGRAREIARTIAACDGIDAVYKREEASRRFELPEDRIGDLVVISGGPRHTKVIGTSRTKHDLSGLDAPLRSHGGVSEQIVPFITNRKGVAIPENLRNYDAFFVGCNHLAGRAA